MMRTAWVEYSNLKECIWRAEALGERTKEEISGWHPGADGEG